MSPKKSGNRKTWRDQFTQWLSGSPYSPEWCDSHFAPVLPAALSPVSTQLSSAAWSSFLGPQMKKFSKDVGGTYLMLMVSRFPPFLSFWRLQYDALGCCYADLGLEIDSSSNSPPGKCWTWCAFHSYPWSASHVQPQFLSLPWTGTEATDKV